MTDYGWQRYWCLLGESIETEGGFLSSPRREDWFRVNERLVTTRDLPLCGALVMLGEAGLGKSTELAKLITRASGALSVNLGEFNEETTLERAISDAVSKGERAGDGAASSVFLDGLDEALIGVPKAKEVIRRCLHGVSRPPCVVLTCRTGAWPGTFTQQLQGIYGCDEVAVYELCMLRRADVEMAAEAESLDADAFLEEVAARGAQPLASAPITLRLLMDLFRSGALPSTRREVYEQGLRALCTESVERADRGSTSRPTGRQLTPEQQVATAARIAACMTLGGCMSLWRGEGQPSDGGAIAIDDIVGGHESCDTGSVDITREVVRAVVGHTGLFVARSAGVVHFAHKTYAEYLTARFLAGAGLAPHQLRSLTQVGEGAERRVVPQLYETVGWLVELQPSLEDELVADEPEILLLSDMRSFDDARKKRFLGRLLDAIHEQRVASLDDALRSGGFDMDFGGRRAVLAGLVYAGVHDDLRIWITDKSLRLEARVAAAEIARWCRLDALDAQCAMCAEDPDEPIHLRAACARFLAEIGSDRCLESLRILAAGAEGDHHDRLKGIALHALWPGHISAPELLAILTPPRSEGFTGNYEVFLDRLDVSDRLAPGDIPNALSWGKQHGDDNHVPPSLGRIASEIAYRAWEHIEHEGVCDALAVFVVRRLLNHEVAMRSPVRHERDWGGSKALTAAALAVSSDAQRRRMLLTACLPLLPRPEDAFHFIFGRARIASSEDFEWAMDQAIRSEGDAALRFAHLACRLCVFEGVGPWRSRAHLDMWLGAREASPAIDEAFATPVCTVLGSNEATESRELHRRDVEREARLRELTKEKGTKKVPWEKALEGYLRAARDKDIRWFGLLLDVLACDRAWMPQSTALNPRDRVGWEQCSPTQQAQLRVLAERYLLECPTQPPAPDKVAMLPRAAAGAALLLWVESRERLEAVADLRLNEIASFVVEGLLDDGLSEQPDPSGDLLLYLLRRCEGATCATIRRAVCSAPQNDAPHPALQRIAEEASPALMRGLLEDLRTALLGEPAVRAVLPWLVERGCRQAVAYAEELLRAGRQDSDRSAAAIALLRLEDGAGWPFVKEAIDRETSGHPALACAIAPDVWELDPLASLPPEIGDKARGEILERLLKVFDPTREPELRVRMGSSPADRARSWRSQLLNQLASSGTAASVVALRSLARQFPQFEWLNRLLLAASVAWRRNAWMPLSPRDLLQLRENNRSRLVRSGNELLRVLVESLRRWESRLHEDDLARTLWDRQAGQNTWRPKDEETLSDILRSHLQCDVAKSGVVLNREVQLSRRTAAAGEAGKEVDILVTAVEPGGRSEDQIRVVIEVKGSWNRGVATDMENQLGIRYLSKHGAAHGLYVVGWFEAPGWDERDDRRNRGPWRSLREANDDLGCRASQINEHSKGSYVEALVLDCRLR